MNADTIIVDGRAYSWRRLCELRRAQLEAQNRERLRQLAFLNCTTTAVRLSSAPRVAVTLSRACLTCRDVRCMATNLAL